VPGHLFVLTHLLLFAGLILLRPMASEGTEKPRQEIWYHTGYPGGVTGPGRGISALMGPTKMPAVFEAIWRHRLVEPGQLHTDSPALPGRAPAAPPIDLESLRAVHSDRYLKALFTGHPPNLATSQGLPVWNENIARGWLLNVGGLYRASETAINKKTITANLGHGYHHATVDKGMGFCTINGLAVVAKKLVHIGKARRVMIIDLDHHEGNGTAECVLGDSSIWNVSIYGTNMGGPPAASNNHLFQVHHGSFDKEVERDANYLAVISSILIGLIQRLDPDLILYQAGMDPHDGAGISGNALAIRDAYVFSLFRSMDKPVTWVLAGGYSDLATLVRLHTETVRMANEVLARVKPGDRIEKGAANPYQWSIHPGVIRFFDWKSLIQDSLGMSAPSSMSEGQVRDFVAARHRLLEKQRLSDDEMRSAYRALFP